MQKKTDKIQLSIDAEKDWQNSTLIYGKKKKISPGNGHRKNLWTDSNEFFLMAFSFQCMTEFTTNKKKKERKNLWVSCSVMSDSAIPWTVACQLQTVALSMEFSRQECWSRLPFPPPGDLPNPVIEPGSPTLAGSFFTVWATRETPEWTYLSKI